ncbi:MAG TPA: hypothetical protein VMH40_01725, partial [Myxococcaceae bacterium]|nr:hypothetical protein [Myxococcaceae bacterium]
AAAARIDSIKAFLPQLSLGPEDLQRATAALDYADTLRQRRNDGSHPNARYPFNDPSEVDELLLSGGRYLPGLWFLTTT